MTAKAIWDGNTEKGWNYKFGCHLWKKLMLLFTCLVDCPSSSFFFLFFLIMGWTQLILIFSRNFTLIMLYLWQSFWPCKHFTFLVLFSFKIRQLYASIQHVILICGGGWLLANMVLVGGIGVRKKWSTNHTDSFKNELKIFCRPVSFLLLYTCLWVFTEFQFIIKKEKSWYWFCILTLEGWVIRDDQVLWEGAPNNSW